MRRALFALAAALLGGAAAIALAELGARAAGLAPLRAPASDDAWSEPHATLGWRNREGRARSNEAGAVPMTFWTDGRRASRPTPEPRSRPVYRVALVGGSWLQGYGVADEQTAAYLVGVARPDVLVENFATGGYGTLQAWLSAELAIDEGRIAPDLVVYGFAPFHAMRNVASYEWLAGLRARSGDGLAPPRAEIDGPRLVVHPPVAALPTWPFERSSALVAVAHARASERAVRDRARWAEPVTQRVLRQFAASMRERGTQLAVALLFGEGEELARYVTGATRAGADVVDCRHPQDLREPHLRVGGTGHPNALAHAHWAACIEGLLARALPRDGR